MQRKQKFSQIKEKVREFMRRRDFRDESRVCEKDFTRKRKLSLVDYMTLILLGCKKSMQVWLDYISDEIKSTKGEYSKQAFSQGRQRIRPEAFPRIFRETVAGFYEDGHYRTYRGYRVCAIDGSDYNLPNTPELLAIYGSETYKDKPQVQAQGSCLFDVLNEVIVDAAFTPCRTGERAPAMQHIEQLSEITTGKELLVLDRGYPPEQLLRTCMKRGFHFIMRCNKDNFFREVRDVTEPDAVITRACGRKQRKLLDRIMKRLQTRLVQVVPGRSFPRTRLHRCLKFPSNQKSAF